MKRKWLALLAAGLSAITVLSFAACSPSEGSAPEESKTRKEQVLEFMDSLNNIEVTGTNVYATSYDDMVAYLKEQNVIASDAEGVDMNTTAGYFWNATDKNNESPANAFAEKAYDYNGVYLMWWDISNGTSYSQIYEYLSSRGRVVIGSGEYTLAYASVRGCYAIGFSDLSATMDQYEAGGSEYQDYADGKETYNDFSARKTAHATQLAVFDAIDDTPTSVDYFTSINDLSEKLYKARLITIDEFVKPVDLNAVYTYNDGANYVSFAPVAYQYGDITVYYFDTTVTYYSYSTFPIMLSNLQENKTTTVYYDNKGWGYSWYSADGIYKYNENKAYDENGTTLTYSVDAIYGNFAISVAEEA
jgi:hypothetical protein